MKSVVIAITIVGFLATLQTRASGVGTITHAATVTAPTSSDLFSDIPGGHPITVAAYFTYTITGATAITNYSNACSHTGGSDGSTAFFHSGYAVMGTDVNGYAFTDNSRSGTSTVTFPNGGSVEKSAVASSTVTNPTGGLTIAPGATTSDTVIYRVYGEG